MITCFHGILSSKLFIPTLDGVLPGTQTWWPMDDSSTIVSDIVGLTDLTTTGSPLRNQPSLHSYNSSTYFTGSSWASISDVPTWVYEDPRHMSISFWMKHSGDFTEPLQSILSDAMDTDSSLETNHTFLVDMTSTAIRLFWEYNFGTNQSTEFTFPGGLDITQDHHYVLSRDATNKTVKFYIDGALIDTQVYTNNPNEDNIPSNEWIVGAYRLFAGGIDRYLKAHLQDMIVLNTPINDTEVAQLYAGGAGVDYVATTGGNFCPLVNSWSDVTTPLSVSASDGIRKSLIGLSSTDIGYVTLPSRNLVMLRRDGSTVSQVGSALTLDYNTNTQVARLTSTKLVYINDLDDQLETVSWDEGTTSWSFVGSSFGAINGGIGYINSIAALSESKVIIYNSTTGTFQVYESVSDGPWTIVAESGSQGNSFAGTYATNGLIHVIDESTFAAVGPSGSNTMRIFTISGATITETADTGLTISGSNKVIASVFGNSYAFGFSHGSSGSKLGIGCVTPDGTGVIRDTQYTLNANTSEYRALTNLPGTLIFAYLGSTEESVRLIEVS